MLIKNIRQYKYGQSAVEYLLLLMAVVAVVLIAFRHLLPRAATSTEGFYNKAAVGIVGKPSSCGDGIQQNWETRQDCCIDAGGCTYRLE